MAGTRGTSKHQRSALVVFAVLAMVATACGARLSDEQRAVAITASQGGGGGLGGDLSGTEGFDTGEFDLGDGGSGTSGGSGGTTGGRRTTTTTTGGGGSSGGGSGGGSRANLTASDVGVTPTEIRIATIADISGVQAGLFQSAHDAAKAAAAYINSQGGINGRQIRLDLLDSKTDGGANRAAVIEACEKSFAIVGSMSAFDGGGARAGEECGIPDISAITVNTSRANAKNVYPAFPNGTGWIATGNAAYLADTFPDAVKSAGILWLAEAVTRVNAQQREEAFESEFGAEFVYHQEVQVVEADYTRFVIDMRDRGVDYVTMVANYQSIIRLQKAMRQQRYVPTVRDWDSVAYDPGYIQEGGTAVEDSKVFLNTALFEEAAQNQEMQLYLSWLKRAAPGANPTYFGIYAWSAFRLFQKVATAVGPDLKRTKVLEALRAMGAWDGNGLHGAHQIGAKKPSPCFLYVDVKDGKFQRSHPSNGFSCDGNLYQLQ